MKIGRAGMVCVLLGALVGCQTPPSVTPLMSVVERTLEREGERLAADEQRATEAIAARREDLRRAFDADLRARPSLDTDWVRQAVSVYVLARETLVSQEESVASAYADRRENLALAAEAQRRAMRLIERRDALWRGVADPRPWMKQLWMEDRDDPQY